MVAKNSDDLYYHNTKGGVKLFVKTHFTKIVVIKISIVCNFVLLPWYLNT